MATCSKCGAEISFRKISGRTIPMGCQCRSNSGIIVTNVPEPTWKTFCPKCSAPVFFVTHNGGAMWFDELGPPWDKHPCFDDSSQLGVGELFKTADFPSIAKLGQFEQSVHPTERVVKLEFVGFGEGWIIPDEAFWEIDPPVQLGDLVGVSYDERTIQLQNGNKFHFEPTTLNRCSRCGHWITSSWHHRNSCNSGSVNTCGICGLEVHWTRMESHVKGHGKQ